MNRKESEAFRYLQHQEGFRVLESDMQPRPIKLRITRPTLGERMKAFITLVRALQGRLGEEERGEPTGDFIGAHYPKENK